MPKLTNVALALPEKDILTRIYEIRGQKVMLDRDLAEMYGVATKVLKQAVRRNMGRFPEDFIFELTVEEFAHWRSQIVTSNGDKMGLRYPPFCFTEQGVAMLSSVLGSEVAIQVNIQIIRVFAKIKQMLLDYKDLMLKMEQIEQKVSKHDKDIQAIFNAVKKLIEQPAKPREPIGFPYPGKK
jgi:hypothetical protein